MTIDDDKSVYVGGLPYDITEEGLIRNFDIYGRVVAVKLVNDHEVSGKCYGFVTFTNPRSAVDAIDDMSGRTIGGRQVVVNEVRSRGGRPNFGREFRPIFERGDRGRGRDKGYDRGRDRQWDRNKGRSQDRLPDRKRSHERRRDHDHHTKDRFLDDDDKARSQDRDVENNEPELDRKRERQWKDASDLEGSEEREMDRSNGHHETGDKDRDQTPKKSNGSDFSDQRGRELSSESDGDDQEAKKELEAIRQRLAELKKQIAQMKEMADEKREAVTQLHEEAQSYEDELTVAKKLTSHRHMQLAKLHRCFQHMKDYGERLKASEHELQSLVDATMMEIDASK